MSSVVYCVFLSDSYGTILGMVSQAKRKRNILFRFILLVAAVGSVWFLISGKIFSISPTHIISPLPDSKSPNVISYVFGGKKNPDDLKLQLLNLIDAKWNNYSIYVKNLNDDFQLDINKSIIYTAASVNKIPILASLYYSAQKGDVDLDKTITLQKDDIQDYGTGSMRYDDPGTVYSVKTLARLMMQKSDNTAAYIIANHILSINTIQSLINTWGLTQTDIINNKTSNNDMAILLEKIVREKIANKAFTQEMLSLLKDSDFEDRLPKLLPKGTTVYHKIGTDVGALHDVGIIVTPKKTYYLGIFTSDITDEAETTDLEAKVSKAVYDFLN